MSLLLSLRRRRPPPIERGEARKVTRCLSSRHKRREGFPQGCQQGTSIMIGPMVQVCGKASSLPAREHGTLVQTCCLACDTLPVKFGS